mmetsp:Transcript_25566/g.85200  ORF Transcript_25566/g.85200 Transcript_25566/m.85200 type:complete len:259 (-) Transcript_25566:258-1034(-)
MRSSPRTGPSPSPTFGRGSRRVARRSLLSLGGTRGCAPTTYHCCRASIWCSAPRASGRWSRSASPPTRRSARRYRCANSSRRRAATAGQRRGLLTGWKGGHSWAHPRRRGWGSTWTQSAACGAATRAAFASAPSAASTTRSRKSASSSAGLAPSTSSTRTGSDRRRRGHRARRRLPPWQPAARAETATAPSRPPDRTRPGRRSGRGCSRRCRRTPRRPGETARGPRSQRQKTDMRSAREMHACSLSRPPFPPSPACRR